MNDDWLKHLRTIGKKGGNATKKRHGKKHFVAMSALAKKKRKKKSHE